MKIAFDENVPPQMVRVFKSLGAEKRFKDFEFVSAKDYAPLPGDLDYIRKSDVPWLERFANEGGKVIISGDVRMTEKALEMRALQQSGFLVFLFERKWTTWDFYQKAALVLFYWQRIATKAKKVKTGQLWRIPNHFRENANFRNVTPDNQQIKKYSPHVIGRSAQKASKARVSKLEGKIHPHPPKGRKGKHETASDERQPTLALEGGGPRKSQTSDDK